MNGPPRSLREWDRGVAVCLTEVGLFGGLHVNLLLIALFVFLAARSEADAVASQASLPDRPAAEEVRARIILLPVHARADQVSRALFAPHCSFPVVQDGEVVGPQLSPQTNKQKATPAQIVIKHEAGHRGVKNR